MNDEDRARVGVLDAEEPATQRLAARRRRGRERARPVADGVELVRDVQRRADERRRHQPDRDDLELLHPEDEPDRLQRLASRRLLASDRVADGPRDPAGREMADHDLLERGRATAPPAQRA